MYIIGNICHGPIRACMSHKVNLCHIQSIERKQLLLHSQCCPDLALFLHRAQFPFQGSDRLFLVRFDLPFDVFDPCQRPVDPPELDLIEKPLEPGGPLTGLCLCQLAEETDLILLLRFELLQNDLRPFQVEARGC